MGGVDPCIIYRGAVADWNAEWWLSEVATDTSYHEEVVPLLIDLLEPAPEHRYLDAGCGEGQGMRAVAAYGSRVVGMDLSAPLLRDAAPTGPVVRAELPYLAWLRDDCLDGLYLMLVIEHIGALETLLAEAARTVRSGGKLVVISNHPAFTAPGAGPLVDPVDGEVTWRWGPYLEDRMSLEPAGEGNVTVYHRPLGTVLTAAAHAGWHLDRLEERGVGPDARERDPILAMQKHIPRLLGARWVKLGGS